MIAESPFRAGGGQARAAFSSRENYICKGQPRLCGRVG